MTTNKRRFLGRFNNLITRSAVYATDSALEIDEQDNFQIVRKRVFFEDVLLVTLHEQVGIVIIFLSLGFAAFLFFLGAVIRGSGGGIVALCGVPFLINGLIRIRTKESIITVFGRRSKARIRFSLRQGRARDLYDELCARVRQIQTTVQEVPADDLDQDSSIRQG